MSSLAASRRGLEKAAVLGPNSIQLDKWTEWGLTVKCWRHSGGRDASVWIQVLIISPSSDGEAFVANVNGGGRQRHRECRLPISRRRTRIPSACIGWV